MAVLSQALDGVTTLTFDCYGTLIDWETGIRRALEQAFGRPEGGLDDEFFDLYLRTEAALEAERYRPYTEIQTLAAQRIAQQMGIDLSPQAAAGLAASLPAWQPFPDTNDGLTRLKKRFRLGIASNIENKLLAETVKHFSVEFDFVVTAEQVQAYKPAHLHFHRVLSAHAPREQLLHVAQSLFHDGVPTRQLGIRFVWINRRQEEPHTDAQPLATFASLGAFADAIEAM
jgi:2-haloacid dehalogenase